MTRTEDRRWLRKAIRCALNYTGQTAPNPIVGCAVVKQDKLLGLGAHQGAGTPHAEVHALQAAGSQTRGATAYVTLEPCNHYGKTPPCTETLINAGIQRVVIGTLDPNPQVHGQGVKRLRSAGIQVDVGVLEKACQDLIRDFNVWLTSKRPFVIYKAATTWDGATASAQMGKEAISGPASQKRVHKLRTTVDAVLIGANTFKRDNPDLRPRLVRHKKKMLRRVVVTSELPKASGNLCSQEPESVLWLCGKTSIEHRHSWEQVGSTVICFEQLPTPQLVVSTLFDLGVYRLLLEGGSTLAKSFLEARLIDWLICIHGPKLAGGNPGVPLFSGAPQAPLTRAITYQLSRTYRIGNDLWAEGLIDY
ncbi:riboflavin biosynthesis protein RibD-like [Ylistrum balloti]|uniref:riboflavin biosynthesis protein RibD-like n=1 Tax=Ylistrum balloti TaxID=509963 RepID=UPI002905EBE1|nr:riboflavin biosynthesis protein RibD-like [Ylistrum balloti]